MKVISRSLRPLPRGEAISSCDIPETGAGEQDEGAVRLATVGYTVIRPDELVWETRPQEEDDAPRRVAPGSQTSLTSALRANLRRYEPGSKGRRHKELAQEETFVVLQGTLTMYLGEPPVREEIPTGGVVHVMSSTPLQIVNEGAEAMLLYAYGAPPVRGQAEFLDSAV